METGGFRLDRVVKNGNLKRCCMCFFGCCFGDFGGGLCMFFCSF